MNNLPQQVTERYVSNLIHYGRNKEFDIAVIHRQINQQDGIVVGVYFNAVVITATGTEERASQQASGATIAQAVRRALEKHGVTFR